MQRFCVDSILLGTDKNLLVDDGKFAWVQGIPKDTWHLDGTLKEDTSWCLDTVFRLSGNSTVQLSPPQKFIKAMSLLSGSLENVIVPWSKVMPSSEHMNFTKHIVEFVVAAMATAPIEYYKGTWCGGNAVMCSLKRAHVDKQAWEALVHAGEGNVPAINSFEPDEEGFAKQVKYDRFKTLTGRLTVESGPQILTLKREHRHMIKSAFGESGHIYALDFAALEVRILLYEYGRNCDELDLYGMIAKELGKDRKAIKGAVISELYGSSKTALRIHLGMKDKELNTFIKNVKSYFNTTELLARIKKQFIATGKVINRYGRPVTIDEPLDHIFISYYGQSTGVDVTMLGFKQVIEQLQTEVPRVRPIFLLHDAMLLDIHDDDLEAVKKINHVKVHGYVQKFPLKLEKIS